MPDVVMMPVPRRDCPILSARAPTLAAKDCEAVGVSASRVVVGVSDVTVDVGPAVDLPTHHKCGETFDPVLFNATMESGNAEAPQVFDSEEQLMGPPQTKLLEGREARFPVGFTVKNPKDLVLEVSPDAGVKYKSVIWQR